MMIPTTDGKADCLKCYAMWIFFCPTNARLNWWRGPRIWKLQPFDWPTSYRSPYGSFSGCGRPGEVPGRAWRGRKLAILGTASLDRGLLQPSGERGRTRVGRRNGESATY